MKSRALETTDKSHNTPVNIGHNQNKLGQYRGRSVCQDGQPVRQWSSTLAREWMEGEPESAGTLYIDGHVRVYHGSLTQLPRRYVARQRLCLRGTTDYWVNAMDG